MTFGGQKFRILKIQDGGGFALKRCGAIYC